MILFIQDLPEVFKPFNDDGMKLLTPGLFPTGDGRDGTKIKLNWNLIN